MCMLESISARRASAKGNRFLRPRESLADGLARLAPRGVDIVIDALEGPLTGKVTLTVGDCSVPLISGGGPAGRSHGPFRMRIL